MDQTQETAVVRGLPVSGRNWKNLELAKKASNRTTTKAMRRSFESRMQLASNQKAIKTTVKEMKEERLAEKIVC